MTTTSDFLTQPRKGYAVVAWVPNTERQSGSVQGYLCVRLTGGDGRTSMMLTLDEVSTAVARSERNRVDVPSWRALMGSRPAAPPPPPPQPEPSRLELRIADLQDLGAKVLAVLEDEPAEVGVPIACELLNEHLEAGDLTLDFGRLGTVAGAIGAQDEQADLLEVLAVELEHVDQGEGTQTEAMAEDLAERETAPLVRAWLRRLLKLLDAQLPKEKPERWCRACFTWTRKYDPVFHLHNECANPTAATPEPQSCDDGDERTSLPGTVPGTRTGGRAQDDRPPGLPRAEPDDGNAGDDDGLGLAACPHCGDEEPDDEDDSDGPGIVRLFNTAVNYVECGTCETKGPKRPTDGGAIAAWNRMAAPDSDDGKPGPDDAASNVCEHGDHQAPPGRRFCSAACERCEHESTNEDTGCDGICCGAATAGYVTCTNCGVACCDYRQRGAERACLLCIEAEGEAMRAAAEDGMHALLYADEDTPSQAERIAAAKRIADAIGHRWPPYDAEPDDDCDDAAAAKEYAR